MVEINILSTKLFSTKMYTMIQHDTTESVMGQWYGFSVDLFLSSIVSPNICHVSHIFFSSGLLDSWEEPCVSYKRSLSSCFIFASLKHQCWQEMACRYLISDIKLQRFKAVPDVMSLQIYPLTLNSKGILSFVFFFFVFLFLLLPFFPFL